MSLKLLSLNVEGDKHLDTVLPFLRREQPDVLCLMEVYEDNLKELLVGYQRYRYMPNFCVAGRNLGVVIASNLPFTHESHYYCDGLSESHIPEPTQEGTGVHRPILVRASIEKDSHLFNFGAVHFTWTPNMSETDKQKEDVARLLAHVEGQQIILTGDFNIPRNNSTYVMLAEKFTDNVPMDVVTTIDPHLHRVNKTEANKLSVVVDYVWSTPQYKVENVRIVDGVSDHCALISDIFAV